MREVIKCSLKPKFWLQVHRINPEPCNFKIKKKLKLLLFRIFLKIESGLGNSCQFNQNLVKFQVNEYLIYM